MRAGDSRQRSRRLAWIGALAALLALALSPSVGSGSHAVEPVASSPVIERSTPAGEARSDAESVAPSACPPGLAGCRTAEGWISYVEHVDPDGDGDAHFVIVDSQGITLPGLTTIDVREGLRPHPLPGVGERISAAGSIQIGSYGEKEIHAVELHVPRGQAG